MAQNHIIPTAINYQTRLIENVRGLKDLMSAAEFKTASSTQMKLIKEISEHLTGMKSKIDELLEKRRKVDAFESAEKKAEQYASIVLPLMNDVREHVDRLEMLVDDELWPMPKLREILFAR